MAGNSVGNIHPTINLRVPTPPKSMSRIPMSILIFFYYKRLLSNSPFNVEISQFCGHGEKSDFTWYFRGHNCLRNNNSYITKFYVHVPKDLYFPLQLRNNEKTEFLFFFSLLIVANS